MDFAVGGYVDEHGVWHAFLDVDGELQALEPMTAPTPVQKTCTDETDDDPASPSSALSGPDGDEGEGDILAEATA